MVIKRNMDLRAASARNPLLKNESHKEFAVMTTRIRTHPAARNRQAGFTLFELIGVLALIAIAMYGLMRLKRTAEVNTNAESLRASVAQIQQQAPNVYPSVFTGLTCATLANNDVFAGTSFRVDKSSPANPVVYYNAEPNSQLSCAPASVVNGRLQPDFPRADQCDV
jgi:prepilin-type N-terminal cleavage/methylation domain-containing protein